MKKVSVMLAVFFIAAMFFGCAKERPLLTEELKTGDIESIRVVLAMGNPEYGADSKIIKDENEIREFVEAFNRALIGKRVRRQDEAVSDVSTYYFLGEDGSKLRVFYFNGNDSKRIMYRSNWHYIDYPDRTPHEIYRDSQAQTIVVDEDLNMMERPS